MNALPNKDDLQSSWEDLQEIYTEYLKPHGVKIPSAERYDEVAKSIWLSVLHYYSGKEVDKNTVSDIVKRDRPDLNHDQQVRHLKRDGWTLIGRGKHTLDPYRPSLEWINTKNRREGRLNARSFDDIKTLFGNKCATCGAREGRPDPRYGEDTVQLQQGHMDPFKPVNMANIIPQCQFCNRAYRSDYVFDEKGRVKAIADIRPVKQAPLFVKKTVYRWLKDFFSKA